MTSTTDFSKKQLAAILSALDDAPRNPANKGEALRAIGRSAKRFGLTTDDVLAAAPGLFDGRLSPADFRVELHDLAGPDQTANGGQQGPTAAPGGADAGDTRPAPTEPPQAAQEPATPEPAAEPAAQSQAAAPATRKVKAKGAKPSKTAPVEKPTPRAGTKQAQMIELLKRPEGATVEQIAAATGWQHHTIRGAISGALKNKVGLTVEATRTREVGPNKTGAKGSSTTYRIVA
jgi:Protein of unknown function (DUF3489)